MEPPCMACRHSALPPVPGCLADHRDAELAELDEEVAACDSMTVR